MPESQRSEWVLLSAFIHYRLADGSKLPIMQREAWCPNCDRFALAERIPTIEELHDEMQQFQDEDPETLKVWAFLSNGRPIAERIAELSTYLEWRKDRNTPPHCLQCGSENPIPVPATGEFTHPATGERVFVGSSGWSDAAPWVVDFSPEGLVIDDENIV